VWNITRFAAGHFEDDREPMADPAYRDVDEWILARCARVAEEVEAHMDEYRYDAALRELREFVWHDLADDYLELIKGRLYEGRPGERDAARQAPLPRSRRRLPCSRPLPLPHGGGLGRPARHRGQRPRE